MRILPTVRPTSLRSATSRIRPAATALSAVAALAALAGCGGLSNTPSLRGVIATLSPYKADIVQGNVVTAEQVKLVKVGMPRTQVRDILGSPLIADAFHAQRWDYVFTFRRQGVDPLQRSMLVLFENDLVSRVEAPDMPSENDFVASISRTPLPTSTPKLELTDAERAALPAPKGVAVAAAAASATATGATRVYPPLEAQ